MLNCCITKIGWFGFVNTSVIGRVFSALCRVLSSIHNLLIIFMKMHKTTVSLFTWHAIIVAFSIVAGLPIVAKFGHNQLCVYMALLIIRTRALCIHNEVKVLKIFFGFLHHIGLVGTHHGSILRFWKNRFLIFFPTQHF